jgi:hypothetical protein
VQLKKKADFSTWEFLNLLDHFRNFQKDQTGKQQNSYSFCSSAATILANTLTLTQTRPSTVIARLCIHQKGRER